MVEDLKNFDLGSFLEDLYGASKLLKAIEYECDNPEDEYDGIIDAILEEIDLPPGSDKEKCRVDLD